MADHSKDEPGYGVFHAGETKRFGSSQDELLVRAEIVARLERVDGVTDGSGGYLIYIDQPSPSDALRAQAAREFAAQLVEWADLIDAAS